MHLRAYAAVALACAFIVPVACDSFEEGSGNGPDGGSDANVTDAPAADAMSDGGVPPSDASADGPFTCTPGAAIPGVKLVAPKLFPGQFIGTAFSCASTDGGVDLGNGAAGFPVDGGAQVKGCAGIDLGEPRLLSEVTVQFASQLTSACNGLDCDCDGGNASLYILYSADDTKWTFGALKQGPAVGLPPETVTYDLSMAPAVRYLALCRFNQIGPVVHLTDPRATCR